MLATGAWPKGNIDHINGVKTDNSLGNLRDVSTSENARNAKRAVTNTSGVTGVCWDAGAGKWRASIKLNNKLKYLGVFEDLQAASAARAEANKRYGFSARHGVDPTGAQVLEVVRVRRKGATV